MRKQKRNMIGKECVVRRNRKGFSIRRSQGALGGHVGCQGSLRQRHQGNLRQRDRQAPGKWIPRIRSVFLESMSGIHTDGYGGILGG